MKLSSFSAWALAISAGAVTWGYPMSAHAACEADADCPKGFSCEVTEQTACPDMAPCAGGDCRPVECDSEPVSSCVSIDCTSDSDCADGMACEAIATNDCPTQTCPADAECPEVEESCEPQQRNYCVPKYLLPCTVSADCGAGFSCKERQSCGCSGSGSVDPEPGAPDSGGGDSGFAPAEDPDATPPAEDPAEPAEDPAEPANRAEECQCEPSGEFACELDRVACDSSADCQAGFTCEENPDGECWAASDGTSGCTEPDPPRLCMPPYVDLYGGGSRAVDGVSSGHESGAPSGAVSGENSGVGDAEGQPRDPDAANASSEASSGGCSLASTIGRTRGDVGAAGLLLLAAAWLRRRQERAR
jgi:hypothetical protein